ncbi:MAG TPA: hypothetical protein VK633_11935, partial [Verrucomicrobiae bacterium]|nr:hypothetical protein [Verrucomicrobiae bacterium]
MSAALKFLLPLLASVILAEASPSISHFAPYAVVPGKKNVLTFSGSNLTTVSNLWTSFGGSTRRLPTTNAELVKFEVFCPETAGGVHALQLAGPDGVSNFQLLLIDAMRVQPRGSEHQSRTNALRITPPAAVDCVLKPEKIDYYRFLGKSGERFSIEVIAHRLGSEMDPVASVFDSDGRELARCDDEPGVWRDARFIFTTPSIGEYLLAVHDAGFGGGVSFDYRLRVGDDPLIWFTYPLVDPSETASPFEPIGAGGRLLSTSPANPAELPAWSSLPSSAEAEPNNIAAQAQRISFPIVLNGKIQEKGDLDYFGFSVEKETKLIFQSQTRSLGSPCDLVLTLRDAEGKVLAQSDSNLPSDAALTNQFSAAGIYMLEVRELSGASAPNVPYRIKADFFQPGISASAEDYKMELTRRGTTSVKLKFARHGYSGPIEL